MRLASAASAAGRPAKGAGSLRLALIGVFAMVLVIVFVTAYGVGSTTINPRRSKHLDLTESSLRLKQEAVRKCRDANAFLQNGGEVVAAQAIAEMERQREELSRTLALERERVTSARSLLQVCRDALATERSALFGVPDSNVSMRLQWLQRRHAFLEAELAKVTTMSPEAAEQHRRSDIRALQAALVREMYSDSPTTNPNTVSEATCAASPARYSVVFDLGSTGNRVHVYKYTMRPGAAAGAKGGAPPRDVLSGLELAEELFELNYRALSKLEDPVREAPEALLELYLKAKNFVPAELHACTPVEFKATAGLRMLGAVKAAEILAEIRARFLKEPLWLRGSAPVRILDGREEGPLAWLTVNFLLGAFGGGGGGAGSGAAAAAPSTVAIIDLGGGSTQIVFEPDNATFHSMHADLRYSTTLGSRSVHAYQHSYEGYGLHAATKELLFHVQGKRQAKPGAASTNTTTTTTTTTTTAKPAEGTFGWDFIADIVGGGGGGDELEGDEVATTVPPLQPPLPPPQLDADAVDAFPCFAVDYEDPLGVRNVKRDDTGRPVVQPSFAACADQFRDRLLKPVGLNCSTAHCGLAGVFQPPLANFTGDIYAFSFLFDLLGLANTSLLPPGAVVSREKFELKLPDLARVGEGHCAALSLARIAEQAAKGNLGSLKPEYECMYYAYVYALLRYGYEVPEDRVLHVAKKIRGYETAWSLECAETTCSLSRMLCPAYPPYSSLVEADTAEVEVQQALEDGANTLFFSHHFDCADVPAGIAALRDQLEILHVDNNYRFTTISPRVTALSHLRWLNASYCALRSVDASISRLSKLERLTLNNNLLAWLPLEIWQLKALEELHLGNNQLRVLPGCLLFLPRLRVVAIENNPLYTREAVNGAAAATYIPAQRSVDCSACCIRSRYYQVFVTFHAIGNQQDIPFVHFVCSDMCAGHVRTRLEAYDQAQRTTR